MGNSLACVSSTQASWLDYLYLKQGCVRVIHMPSGKVCEYGSPMTVAELMLEHPHHFVCQSMSLHAGDPPLPLSADELLLPLHLYALLPMCKLHCRLSIQEIHVLSFANKKAKPSKHNDCKIAPFQPEAEGDSDKETHQKAEVADIDGKRMALKVHDDDQLTELCTQTYSALRGKCWRPNLPSISESSLLNVS